MIGIRETARDLHRLLEARAINSGFILGRVLFERIVNALFLQIADSGVRDDYTKYWLAKVGRSRERSTFVGEIGITVKHLIQVDREAEAAIKKAEARFVSKRGRRLNRWSILSLQDKVNAIAKAKKVTREDRPYLGLAALHIYDAGAEASHGSSWGSIFHYNLSDKRDEESLLRHHLSEVTFLYFVLGACLSLALELMTMKEERQVELESWRRETPVLLEKFLAGRTERSTLEKPEDGGA